MRILLLVIVLLGAVNAQAAADQAPVHQCFAIGLSPYLDQGAKDQVYRNIISFVVQELPLGSHLAIYDACDMKTVAQFEVPTAQVFENAKTRANQFAPAIRQLKMFLATDHSRPTNTKLRLQNTVHLPQFCDFLIENGVHDSKALNVLIIGSPLYEDVAEPAFSMVDGFFPSDAHLNAAREVSVYGRASSRSDAQKLIVHWLWLGNPWLNDLHQEKISRFWGLYLETRGGELASFSGDSTSAFKHFSQGDEGSLVARKHWAADSTQTKVEMLRVSREVARTDWITREAVSSEEHAPAQLTGPMKIGIRWKDNIDLDLYATPRAGAETLFFQHPRSPEGYYYKDHRASPGREFEFIEFESPVDLRQVQAYVNFYKGSVPVGPRGEVRIEFAGRIYQSTFTLEATEGNRGQAGAGQDSFWRKLPVQEILHLVSLANTTRD